MNSMIAFNSNGAFNALYVMIGTIIFVIIFSVIDMLNQSWLLFKVLVLIPFCSWGKVTRVRNNFSIKVIFEANKQEKQTDSSCL